MTADEFVPVGFDPPTSLTTNQLRLEPLGPQHNQAGHAAWMSSIEHIRSTPGFLDRNWPPRNGMTLEQNLSDLRRHAGDFTRGAGFTFTVLDPGDNDVIGCVYLYPSAFEEWDVTVKSWVWTVADLADECRASPEPGQPLWLAVGNCNWTRRMLVEIAVRSVCRFLEEFRATGGD